MLHAVVVLTLVRTRPPPPRVACDRSHTCPAGTTCCSTVQGSWGCCGAVNATCCADMQHCCPPKYPICDAGKCVNVADDQSVPWLAQLPSAVITFNMNHLQTAPAGTACCGCIDDNGNPYDKSCEKNCDSGTPSACASCIRGGRLNETLDYCAHVCGCSASN